MPVHRVVRTMPSSRQTEHQTTTDAELDPAQSLGCLLTLCRLAAGARGLVAHSSWVGNAMEGPQIQARLDDWLAGLSTPPPGGQAVLTEARSEVTPDPAEPGAWRALLHVRLAPPWPDTRTLSLETGLRQSWMFR